LEKHIEKMHIYKMAARLDNMLCAFSESSDVVHDSVENVSREKKGILLIGSFFRVPKENLEGG